VKWGKDDIDGYLNFYSISGDGRVSNWTIVKTAMWHTDVLNIGFERRLKNFENQGNLFKLKDYRVGRNNIVTGLYDVFTALYNMGVEGFGYGDSNKRLYISKPQNQKYFDLFTFKTKELKARDYVDAKNKKILEARRLKQMFNFDQSLGTNFSPDMQLPKSNVFAYQKSDGAEFVVPFDYSTSGIYDFNLPIYQKLFKQ